MQFYNVRKRKRVEVSDEKIKKTVYESRKGQKRYAARAVDDDGTMLTKFISKEMFDGLDVPME
ncbi:MAG: hypothetical protein M1355_02770 [Patescibacteria group bacterium]|nr:hypothetical protein [Patescibacteria group bacterium]